MRKQAGFTLVELMVSLAIVGILFTTAIPVYNTWQQRAYGQEATLMAKQILDGQILYYLEHDNFYPAVGDDFIIPKDDPPSAEIQTKLQEIETALKIRIPVGHHLNYQFINNDTTFLLQIYASFDLFKGSFNGLTALVDESGRTSLFPSNISL